jgi:hypothetical protein
VLYCCAPSVFNKIFLYYIKFNKARFSLVNYKMTEINIVPCKISIETDVNKISSSTGAGAGRVQVKIDKVTTLH